MGHHFWYILIHVGLGLVGFQWFTFTNEGGLLAFAASTVVQGYAVWEIHRLAWPRFKTSHAQAASHLEGQKMMQDYKVRLARMWFFRCCIYSLLTLMAAMAAGGGR